MRSLSRTCLVACLCLLGMNDLVAPASAAEAPITFESHVRPILKAQCFHCHGEDGEKKGGLDLRLVRFMATGGESGPAVEPGKAQSLLLDRITSDEMPPGEKKLSAAEKSLIERWIAAGAKTAKPEPQQLSEFTDDEVGFWSFQPVRRPPLPQVTAHDRVRTPIDAFILAKLEAKQLTLSPEADRRTLIRRAYFDLVGLPPTPEAVDRFIHDPAPDAYERLIDELLESPRYGERWARHWLDVAGYADSDGYSDKDLERKYAYKYRDYLIRALNADRPWNELIQEQLAGDELAPAGFKNLSPTDADKLIATGFLRMGPDGTGDTAVDPNVARNDCVAETIKIVSTSLLGLTVGCAQCHTHRYDPITHVDYHRLRAVFEPALDWKLWRVPQARLVSLWSDEQKALAAACDAEVKRLTQERTDAYEQLAHEVRERGMEGLEESLKQQLREAFKTPVAKRSAEQKALLVKYPKANIPVATFLERNAKAEYTAITDRFAPLIEAAQKRRPAEDFAHCLTEIPGRVSPTFLFHRGDFNQPKQAVEPGELAVLCSTGGGKIAADDAQLPTSGRRLAYARHLTDGRHPLVGRVFVNRVWLHHFGRGIVNTPGDFGTLGERPTHPELLDWLADEFVASGWKLKQLHRLIMTSSVYRQESKAESGKLKAGEHVQLSALGSQLSIDSDNRLLWRMNLRRLDAETLRDAILATSGKLTHKLYGPAVPVAPDEAGQVIIGVDTRDGAGRPTGKKVPLFEEEFRRSVYVQVRRTLPLAMLDAFDAATPVPNCTARSSSTVAPQSLLLMNNDFVVQQADHFAARIIAQAGKDLTEQARWAWRLALSLDANSEQLATAVAFIRAQTDDYGAIKTPSMMANIREQRALSALCQALYCSNPFLYVD
ncbi:MAG: PSD1 domain-containing protein [Planctomycetaceae bacterium]|nr:PSD1 domain-containing protein [Planctomycetaceae bacterium]